MALVQFPAGSMKASGNVGDINFTNIRGRAVARAASAPTGTPTPKQIAQRALMTAVTAEWGTNLTPSERAEWERVAMQERYIDRLGQQYIPTGYQMFIRLNIQGRFFGGTLMKTPPVKPDGVFVLAAYVNWNEAGSRPIIVMKKADGVAVDADGFQVFRAGPYDSGGRKAIEPEFRYFGKEESLSYMWDYTTTAGKWYWYRIRWFFETGYVGNWWEDQVKNEL